jgi:hypothetical protein
LLIKVSFLTLLFLAGCMSAGDMKNLTSGRVGCPANEITIEEHSKTIYSTNWTAACKDRKYYCVQDESSAVYTVSCKAGD